MAGGLSLAFRARSLNWVFQKTPATQPATDYAVSLHTGDPGDDASNAAATEPSGTGSYARAVLTAANITAAADTGGAGSPKAISNTASVSFPASSAAWSTGATNLTWYALWFGASRATTVALTDYVGRAQLTTPQAVNAAGITLTFAAAALVQNMDDT